MVANLAGKGEDAGLARRHGVIMVRFAMGRKAIFRLADP